MCQICKDGQNGIIRQTINLYDGVSDTSLRNNLVRGSLELHCKAAGQKIIRLKANARQAHIKMRRALNATEPKLIRTLVKTWNAQKKALKYNEIEAALKLGNLSPVALATWKKQYQDMLIDEFTPQYEAISRAAWTVLEGDVNHLGFALAMPKVAATLKESIERREAFLKNVWTDSQAQSVNTVIKYFTVDNPINPKDAARYIRPLIGLTPNQSVAVLNRRALLEKDGLTGDALVKATQKYADSIERRRAENIVRTEMATAYNQSELIYFQEAISEGVVATVMQTWLTAEDERTCDICAALDGEQVDLNEYFQPEGLEPVQCPPAHNSCRCTTTFDVVLP